jgi:hypothetical protein
MRSRDEIVALAQSVLCRDPRCQHHRRQAEEIVLIVEEWLGNQTGTRKSPDHVAVQATSKGSG